MSNSNTPVIIGTITTERGRANIVWDRPYIRAEFSDGTHEVDTEAPHLWTRTAAEDYARLSWSAADWEFDEGGAS